MVKRFYENELNGYAYLEVESEPAKPEDLARADRKAGRQTLDFPVCQQFFPGVASVRRSSLASIRFKCATEGTGYAAREKEASAA